MTRLEFTGSDLAIGAKRLSLQGRNSFGTATIPSTERGCASDAPSLITEREARAGTYFVFMTNVPPSSGISMPLYSYFSKKLARNSRADAKFSQIGAVMNDQSQGHNASPYSPLLCILLLLATGVAVKFGAANPCMLSKFVHLADKLIATSTPRC